MRPHKNAAAATEPAARLDFPSTGFVRLHSILAPNGPIPVGKTTWWQGVKTGRFPKPVKLGPRITVWRAEDIRQLIETGVAVTSNQPLAGADRPSLPPPSTDTAVAS
jgi:prophage regulatory protein